MKTPLTTAQRTLVETITASLRENLDNAQAAYDAAVTAAENARQTAVSMRTVQRREDAETALSDVVDALEDALRRIQQI